MTIHVPIKDADRYHQMCSSNRSPTLHQVIPVLETLCSKWERRLEDPEFEIFYDAIRLGLEKLNKYYKRLDNTDAYILAMRSFALQLFFAHMLTLSPPHLVLHPYYKLNYIEEQWGGAEEYEADVEAGDPHARDWQKHAREVVDKAVRRVSFVCSVYSYL